MQDPSDKILTFGNLDNLLYFVVILALYSLIINCIFGHPTFWRSFKPKQFHRYVEWKVKKMGFFRTHYNFDNLLHSDSLNEDSVIHIMHYLDSYSLANVSIVSRSMKSITERPVVWNNIISLAFPDHKLDWRVSNKMQFYSMIHRHYLTLLKDAKYVRDRLMVSIHGELFDLTEFAELHPGGKFILQEVAGKDATVLFDRASHSSTALALSRKYCVWSAVKFVGRKGMPFACKCYLLTTKSTLETFSDQ